MNDRDLIAAWRRGESDFEEIDRRFRPRLTRFLLGRNLCRADDVEDRIQLTMVRAVAGIETLREPGHFFPWLCQIARRACFDEGRKKRPVPFTDLGGGSDGFGGLNESDGPDGQHVTFPTETRRFEKSRRRRNLWTAAHELLGEEEFRLLWLHYAENRSDDEIAGMTEKSPGAVRAALCRIRQKLAKNWKGEDG